MERPIFQPIGTPEEELDTPALVVDLDAMNRNIAVVHQFFSGGEEGDDITPGSALRPNVSCHGCPEVAFWQLSSGEDPEDVSSFFSGGIAVNSLGEAEAFAASGINDILITGRVVTIPKIRRLMALARDNSIVVAVDSASNVERLSEAADAEDVLLPVVVDIDTGRGFGGVLPGADAVELAHLVNESPHLIFRGITTSEGPINVPDSRRRGHETFERLLPLSEIVETMGREGLDVAIFSAGDATNYDAAAIIPGITDVQADVYPLMDAHTLALRPEMEPAAKVLATVISHPAPERAVVDAGHKTLAPDFGLAQLDGVPGAIATRFSAEHGIMELEGVATGQLKPGEKVKLIPYSLALCTNQFDYIRAVRDGRLVGYWPIVGRGRLD